ncbi:MAG TPA: ArsA family ATPase [Pseudidiomarina sp.]|nr:ArsA family ATPase [Pseudidiomarina sp.]
MFTQKVVFIGGKGGVGKTTIASALALRCQQAGERVLIVSTDPAHSLADAFAQPIGDTIITLMPGLDALEIDPDREVVAHIERVTQSMKKFTRPDMFAEIERQMRLTQQSPGAQEAALLERIATLIDEAPQQYDRVIFDTAPTGHTLRLLTLPEAMAAWTQGLLRHDSQAKQLQGVLDHLTPKAGKDISNPFSDAREHQLSNVDQRAADITTALLKRQRLFHRTRHILTAHEQTALFFVLTPEKLPILETVRAVNALRKESLPIHGLFINRNLPQHADGEFLAQRRAQERVYRGEIETQFAELQRHYIPLLPTDINGIHGLQSVIAHLPW